MTKFRVRPETTQKKSPAPKAKAAKAAPKRNFTRAEIEANLADAGFHRDRPLAGPYAIKKQRAERDAQRATKAPKRGGKVTVLTAKNLKDVPWLVHGFSTRQGGVSEEYGGGQLNLGITREDSHENVHENRRLFLNALGAVTRNGKSGQRWPLMQTKQIHSSIVHRVRAGEHAPGAGDGFITNDPGVLLAVKTADCMPVIAVDVKRKAVGVFHAGWRGTAKRIVEKGIGEMRRQFGSNPKEIRVAIGPGIGVCCYQVGEEVREEFQSQFPYADELFEEVFDSYSLHVKYPLLFLNQRAPGHGEMPKVPHLDLVKANARQAMDAGVPAKNIDSLEKCTACHTDIFFSHRKEHVTGRMMGAVGIRKK